MIEDKQNITYYYKKKIQQEEPKEEEPKQEEQKEEEPKLEQTIQNSYSPKTGDKIYRYYGLLAISIIGLVVTLIIVIKKKNK